VAVRVTSSKPRRQNTPPDILRCAQDDVKFNGDGKFTGNVEFCGGVESSVERELVDWMRNRPCYVYMMANVSRMIYVGVTSDLEKRVSQHKDNEFAGYTQKYNLKRLVYCESFGDIRAAIEREKQLKGWVRSRKVAFIRRSNPKWQDLGEDWATKGMPIGTSAAAS
jgi:putative endonuclease